MRDSWVSCLVAIACGCGGSDPPGVSGALGGSGGQWAMAVASGPDGEVAVGGEFDVETRFGTFTATSVGQRDGFVVVLEADGSVRWARAFGGRWGYGGPGAQGRDDLVDGVVIDGNGDVIVSGYAEGEVDFGAGAGPTPDYYSDDETRFVAKYAGADGSLIWSKRVGGPLLVDGEGNVYLGQFDYGPDDAGYWTNTISILALDPDGGTRWQKTLAAHTSTDPNVMAFSWATAVTPTGRLVFASQFSGTLTIGGTPLVAPPGAIVTALAWFDGDGDPVSTRLYTEESLDVAAVAATDDGTVAAMGAMVSLIGADGEIVWSRPFGADGLFPCDVGINPDGDVVGLCSRKVAQFTGEAGTEVWSRSFGPPLGDYEFAELASLDLAATGAPVVAGSFRGTLALDTGSITSADASIDVFVEAFPPTP